MTTRTACSSFDENVPMHGKAMKTDAIMAESKKRPALRDLSNRQPAGPQTRTAKAALANPLSNELRDKLTLATSRPFKVEEPVRREVGILDCDFEDEMQNAEYAPDIYRNLWKAEGNYSVLPSYMTQQADINERMRSILVDWLVDVHLKFKLRTETLFLTVHVIDRYLAKEQTTRNKLQLVGCTAMLVAAKYEEIYAPEVRDFVYISDKAYTREEIIAMEAKILNALDWDLCGATPWNFHHRFCSAGRLDEKTRLTAEYLMERYLQEIKSLHHLPSKVTAGAVSLALRLNGLPTWNSDLAKYTRYSEDSLRAVQAELLDCAKRAPNSSLKAVFRKFSHAKFSEVALLPLPDAL